MDFCEQKYFLQYNLAFKDSTNKKALMGTIVHKALQVLADKKLCIQKGNKSFGDGELGRFSLRECDNIPKLTEKAFDFYSGLEPDVGLTKAELKKCTGWVEKALSYNNGLLDPRNQDVFATEKFFDIEIDEPWAKFSVANTFWFLGSSNPLL